MAAPIGHIYLALKILTGPLNGVDEQAFMIGTSFPDIRYPAGLSRKATHANSVLFSDILNESDPFKQGMLFHALVDQEHAKFVAKNKINSLLPNIPLSLNILKGVEDIILLEQIPYRPFIRYFDNILEQEIKIVHDEKIIRAWHTALQNYFFYGPTPQTIKPLLRNAIPNLGLVQPMIEEGAAYGFKIGMELIKLNDEIIQKIKYFYSHFDPIALHK